MGKSIFSEVYADFSIKKTKMAQKVFQHLDADYFDIILNGNVWWLEQYSCSRIAGEHIPKYVYECLRTHMSRRYSAVYLGDISRQEVAL